MSPAGPGASPNSAVTLTATKGELFFSEQHVAILVVDMFESVRLIANYETDVIGLWQGFVREVVGSILPRSNSRLVKSLGDGLMCEFAHVRCALDAAFEMHKILERENTGRPVERMVLVRAGIHLTTVITDERDIYGAGVNLAARIASLAGPGETIISIEARDSVTDTLDAELVDLGASFLKHIEQPVHVFRAGPAGDRSVLLPAAQYTGPFRPTIAIVPFVSRSKDRNTFDIGELIADLLISRFGRSAQLSVISRLSARAFRGSEHSAQQLGGLLGAHYVVVGSYLAKGVQDTDRLLVSIELTDLANDEIVWQERATLKLGELFEIESEIINRFALEVHRTILDLEVQKALTHPLPTLESYSLLMAGVNLMHRRGPKEFEVACRSLESLIERVPRHVHGYAWLGKALVFRAGQGLSQNEATDSRRAIDLLRHALDLSPSDGLALAIDGIVHANLVGDYSTAAKRFEQALEVDPSNAIALLYFGALRAFERKGADAVSLTDRAMKLSPLDPYRYLFTGIAASAAIANDEYDRAVDLATESLRLNRGHLSALRVKVIALVLADRTPAAREFSAELLRQAPDFTVSKFRIRSKHIDAVLRERFSAALIEAGIPA